VLWALVLVLLVNLAAAPLAAQQVRFCDDRADLEAVPEPWVEYTRTFANGNVRAALVNALEPAQAPFFLVVLHPPRDEYGARTCSMIGSSDSYGYTWLDFHALHAEYDPSLGLSLTLPARLKTAGGEGTERLHLTVTLNQTTGKVIAHHAEPTE
jgi:hypothetical protein